MRITISNNSYSVHFKAEESSEISTRTLRSSKQQLISGGVYIHNAGMYKADNDFRITARLNSTQLEKLLLIADTGEIATIFTRNGVFTGYISSIAPNTYPVSITVLIKSEVVSSNDIIYPEAPEPVPEGEWYDITENMATGEWNCSLIWDGDSWVSECYSSPCDRMELISEFIEINEAYYIELTYTVSEDPVDFYIKFGSTTVLTSLPDSGVQTAVAGGDGGTLTIYFDYRGSATCAVEITQIRVYGDITMGGGG